MSNLNGIKDVKIVGATSLLNSRVNSRAQSLTRGGGAAIGAYGVIPSRIYWSILELIIGSVDKKKS